MYLRSLITNITSMLICRCPRYFANWKRPGGWVPSPPGFLPSRPNFLVIFLLGMFSGSRNPTVIMKKILSLLLDFDNQGQTPFCMTFHISGCKHDKNSILVSILTFSRSRISKCYKKSHDLNGWLWNSRLRTFVVWPFLAPAVYMLQTWSRCRF